MFTFGALFIKRATVNGISVWTATLISNMWAVLLFNSFWLMGGHVPDLIWFWQPAVVAMLYIGGQCFILSAVQYGDVSVATPVASAKVIIVTFLLTILTSMASSRETWLAAILATLGVVMINFAAPKSEKKIVVVTVLLALGAATTFATFDVCVQTWSPRWGTGRILPISFLFVGIFSLFFIPWSDSLATIRKSKVWKSLLIGGFFVGSQATFLVYALSTFEDAARLNVIYSLRGLWGVIFAWLLADLFGGHESKLPTSVMIARLFGAALLVVAVVVTIATS